jgi:hypothetical protein
MQGNFAQVAAQQ